MVLSNLTNERVVFKIKTTAPRRYCVRPNSGLVGPKEKSIITIMLQPQDFDPAAERGKHKFMVQSCLAPANFTADSSMDQVLKETSPDKVSESRLKCTFVEDEQPVSEAVASPISAVDVAAMPEKFVEKTVPKDQASESGKGGQEVALATENDSLRAQLAALQQQHNELRQSELRLRGQAVKSSVQHATSTQAVRTVQHTAPLQLYAIAVLIALLLGVLVGRFVL